MSRRPLGKLRIIGGQWRSRIVEFADGDGVRPTPDRVRQTLYDWLAPHIEGAEVLDLFAGSGALGLEALSRGAAFVSFCERGAEQARAIRDALHKLGAANAQVRQDEALALLARETRQYDLVLLDPPYASPLLQQALDALPPRLKAHNRVYLEWPRGKPPQLAAGWSLLREKQAGQVCFGLASWSAPATDPVPGEGARVDWPPDSVETER